ncbi:TetR/AcrR family transcriptional regulator [Actinophytocola sp.]|uniref:TetR/AcrR family transcriptional regulator n=1 Tax=Actinophytocola sp. TaxID=1872138 RepID=UPI002ED5B13C
MRTKAQQREETTRSLVGLARALFAEKGYPNVTLAEVVAKAGVTKGALYHYFEGKDDLFRAVLAEVHEEVARRVGEVDDTDRWTRLIKGCRTFLAAATDPNHHRIMLVDGPAVLGWQTWRELDATTSMRHLTELLQELIDEGTLVDQPVIPLAHLLSGAMNEAALWLSASPDPSRDLDQAMTALTRMLTGLRPTPT